MVVRLCSANRNPERTQIQNVTFHEPTYRYISHDGRCSGIIFPRLNLFIILIYVARQPVRSKLREVRARDIPPEAGRYCQTRAPHWTERTLAQEAIRGYETS
jgi:hypothetical protein